MRIEQPEGTKGSLKWIQRAVARRETALEEPILHRISDAVRIEWLSPVAEDGFAEYRDASFIERLGEEKLSDELAAYWPSRGPQWDALGKTDNGHVLLVEAKAHILEMCSPPCKAGPKSRDRIEAVFDELAERLKAGPHRAAWTDHFYQIANRLAHLDFLRRHGVKAWLVFVNFVGDEEMAGPKSPESWEAAMTVAMTVMGLGRRHSLSNWIFSTYPDVRGLA